MEECFSLFLRWQCLAGFVEPVGRRRRRSPKIASGVKGCPSNPCRQLQASPRSCDNIFKEQLAWLAGRALQRKWRQETCSVTSWSKSLWDSSDPHIHGLYVCSNVRSRTKADSKTPYAVAMMAIFVEQGTMEEIPPSDDLRGSAFQHDLSTQF